MAIGLEVVASNIAAFLQNIAPIISIILIVLGGITYGLAQAQPADMRGKWQTAAVSMLIGGVIIAVITGAADIIQTTSSQALQPA
ncbi:hypothetical protein GF318_04785 [Candidatus Micrarchaeota archaeon]|nr:hypothetical protein [Candidatus Micrarchaeota archaeon]